MGQQKGNPTPSYQNEAYETLRPNTNARENRDYGTKPVMIDDNTTLNAVIDATFGTDTDISTLQAAVATKLSTADAITTYATNSTILAVSSSIDTRLNAVSQSLSASINIPGTYANDTAAATAGVRIGGLYHTTGTVKVRLT
jgi:hypothetical protein